MYPPASLRPSTEGRTPPCSRLRPVAGGALGPYLDKSFQFAEGPDLILDDGGDRYAYILTDGAVPTSRKT